jgi:hypothetical protein
MNLDFLGRGLKFPFSFHRRSGGAQVSSATSAEHEHIHDSPQNTDRNLLLVRIAYRVIQSQVEGNLVYPFYREPRRSSPPRQFRAVAGK